MLTDNKKKQGEHGYSFDSDQKGHDMDSGMKTMEAQQFQEQLIAPFFEDEDEEENSYVPNLFVEIGEVDYSRSDERILQDIHDKLARVTNFDANNIEIIVENGLVTLNGMVEESVTKGIIEYTISDLEGIKDIINNLKS